MRLGWYWITQHRFTAKGYQVCVQHVDTMGFFDEEIIDFIEKVTEFKPLAYSVVDTFGAMYEEDMASILVLRTNTSQRIFCWASMPIIT